MPMSQTCEVNKADTSFTQSFNASLNPTNSNRMDTISITSVTLSDIDPLQKIGQQTFSETFSAGNTEENMKEYLKDGFSVEKMTAELHDENSEFYFATVDNIVVGYLKLNFGQSQTELKEDKALEIERIYVLDEFHGKGVGQVLYEQAIKIARQKNAAYVWLGVWEENPRAINFYKKNGFVEFDKHVFKLGNDEQTDIMMKLQLKD
jgi:diamine N-acetyltransferase